MQETMTIKEVEEVIKMKLFTFIADYKGGTYISQYVAKTLEEALNLWINNVDFFTDKQLKSFKKNIKYGDIDPPTKLNGLSNVWCTCFISRFFYCLYYIKKQKSTKYNKTCTPNIT